MTDRIQYWEIEDLTHENIKQASRVLDEVFAYCGDPTPSLCFNASLNPDAYRQHLNTRDIRTLRYFVAHRGQEVVGVSGVYEKLTDHEQAAWLGWFWVASDMRRHGLGTALLQRAMSEAVRMGKAYFRLYTSDDPREVAAQYFYLKHGLIEVRRDEPQIGVDGRRFITIYREKKLLTSLVSS